ncbi:MAG: hypothetical protein ACKOF9_06520 [Burkholderiales bacterium]
MNKTALRCDNKAMDARRKPPPRVFPLGKGCNAADALCRHNPSGRGPTGHRRVSQPACGDAHHGAVCSYACGLWNPGAGLSY